jgi:hypothetical protein
MSALKYFASLALLSSAGASAEGLASQLDGEWRLVSSEQVLADGTRGPSPLYGPGGVGFLIFTKGGEMCAITAAPQSKETNAYCGRYELNEAEGYLVFNVQAAGMPQDIGDILKRYISFDGDRLKLRTAKPHPGIAEYTLTWQRM